MSAFCRNGSPYRRGCCIDGNYFVQGPWLLFGCTEVEPFGAYELQLRREEDPSFLGVFLKLCEATTEKVLVRSDFRVLVPSSGVWELLDDHVPHPSPGEGKHMVYAAYSDCWGLRTAISHAGLVAKSSEYVYGGALTLRVDFDFQVEDTLHHFAAHRVRQVQLYESADLADFTLVSSEKHEFRVHRAILAAHSSVFLDMFKHGTVEQETGRADIPDVDEETLRVMLMYVYCGSVSVVAEVAEKVLKAADKYDIPDLRQLTIKILSVNLTPYNALRLLTIADQRNLPELNKAAAESILKHAELFRLTEDFQQLKEKNSLLFSIIDAASAIAKSRSSFTGSQ